MGTVLIAEPHPDTRRLLEKIVAGLGHRALVHSDSSLTERVDTAIVEPGEAASYEVAKTLRAQGVPLIFVSLYVASEDTAAMQPFAYLTKPFSVHTLERTLADALGA